MKVTKSGEAPEHSILMVSGLFDFEFWRMTRLKFSCFVFQNKQALDAFVNSGWEASAQTSLAAVDGDQELVLDATLKGTKYYKNDDLN